MHAATTDLTKDGVTMAKADPTLVSGRETDPFADIFVPSNMSSKYGLGLIPRQPWPVDTDSKESISSPLALAGLLPLVL